MLRTYTFALFIFLCSVTSLSASNYYWVGGSGDWSDLTHWGIASGDTINYHQIVPSPNDSVYFDGNSGFLPGDVVTIDVVHAFCYNMDWTGALNHPTLRNSQGTNTNLFIHGSLTFIQNMDFDYDGAIKFEAIDIGHTITSGLQYLENIYFTGNGGVWTLQDSLSSNDITHSYGTLVTDNHSIQIDKDYYSQGNGLRHLDFGSSTIYMTNYYYPNFVVQGAGITADLDSTTIIYNTSNSYVYNRTLKFAHNSGIITLYKVIFKNTMSKSSTDRILGSNSSGTSASGMSIIKYVEAHNKTLIESGYYHHCSLFESASIYDNNSFDTLILTSAILGLNFFICNFVNY